MQTIAEHEAHIDNRDYELETARVLLARSESERDALVQRLHQTNNTAVFIDSKNSDDLRRSDERRNEA
eukprot:12171252-Heterocapsa_arctica.AAC.1